MRKTIVGVMSVLGAMSPLAGAQTAEAPSYPQSLAVVYGAYQRILTLKEACNSALPKQTAQNEKAFAAWKARNRNVLDDIDGRVTAMIKRQSKDAKDYARNIGKYESGRLQERQDGKKAFLALPHAEVEQLCDELPKTLSGGDTDLESSYPEELRTIRSRPQ